LSTCLKNLKSDYVDLSPYKSKDPPKQKSRLSFMEIQNIRPPPFKLPDKTTLESSDPLEQDNDSPLSVPTSESTPPIDDNSSYQTPISTPNDSTYFNNSVPMKIELNTDPGAKNTIASLQRLGRRVKIMMKPKGQLKSLVSDKMQLSTLTILPHYMEEIHSGLGVINNQNFNVSSGINNEVHNYNPGENSNGFLSEMHNGSSAQSFNELESLENVRALRQNLSCEESLHSGLHYNSIDSISEETMWPIWDGTDGVHFV